MVQGTLDLAVRRHVIPGHQVVGIDLKTYRPNAEEWAARNAPWVFVTDEQVRHLADGITVTTTDATGKAPARRRRPRHPRSRFRLAHDPGALPAGPVCPGATGRTRYMSYVTAAGRLSAVAEALGIDPAWHAHNLRHQFASEEAATGANIADLSETLGHQSPDVTFRRYVRSMPGRLARMAGRMNGRWTTGPAPVTPAREA
jgi:integrase